MGAVVDEGVSGDSYCFSFQKPLSEWYFMLLLKNKDFLYFPIILYLFLLLLLSLIFSFLTYQLRGGLFATNVTRWV